MTTTYEGLTAEEWRAKAREYWQRRQDSWERSDTDGFLSQWSSGLMAEEYEEKARLAERGGVIEVRALFDAETGKVASTHSHDGQWGLAWVLNDEAAEKAGKRFISESKAATPEKRAAAMRKKGFTTGLVRVKGFVTMAGSGRGLSGAASVRVVVRPDLDALKSADYEVVTTALDATDRRN